MRVAVKTLNQQTIEIDIDDHKTVLDLKAEIFHMLGGDYVVERQKLICGGTIMEDENKLSMYNTGACKFIVVMLRGEMGSDISQYNTNTAAAANTNPASTTQIVSESESLFLTGRDYQLAVDIMVEIGFERAQVERAMAASFNNPERAFEYLTSELPQNTEAQPSAASSNANTQINAETVNQVLDLLRQNPNLLTATLQQMGVTNTELLEQIRTNPDEFFNLVRQQNNEPSDVSISNAQEEPITPRALDEFRRSISAAADAAVANSVAAGEADRAAQGAAAAAMATFTPADRAAIERLKAMGFQEVMAVQAYIAFDKNEALAANFLASNVDDEN